MKKQIISALLICCIASLSGCGKSEKTPSAPQPVIPQTTTTSEYTEPEIKATEPSSDSQTNNCLNPLTGVYDFAESAVGKRPVAVMVNNIKASLPQYGIAAADIIYELPVEGGITRLMAVYADYSSVPEVCSVRSCRYYYPILCLGMDAVYCHWGLDKTIAKDTLERTGIDHLDGEQLFSKMLFKRDPDREKKYAQEHTGYLNGPELAETIDKYGFRTDVSPEFNHTIFNFADKDSQFVPDGDSASEVTLRFSNDYYSTFQFDSESGEYKKLHSGQPQIDQHTDTQLSFENVLILQTNIYPRENGYLMDVELSGGSGYYASNGSVVPITWEKASETSPIKLYDSEGSELLLNAGKSYIGIIGYDKNISYS